MSTSIYKHVTCGIPCYNNGIKNKTSQKKKENATNTTRTKGQKVKDPDWGTSPIRGILRGAPQYKQVSF